MLYEITNADERIAHVGRQRWLGLCIYFNVGAHELLRGPPPLRQPDRKVHNVPGHYRRVGKAECIPRCNAACDADNAVRSDNPAASQSVLARRLRSFPAVPFESPA